MNTVLFDLDGTLLPMNQEHFMKVYFSALAEKCAQFGFTDKQQVLAAVWKGTGAMVANDGSRLNADIFWQVFDAEMGGNTLPLKPALELFYENEFHAAKVATGENPHAAALLEKLRAAGVTLVLATNPLFPLCAVRTRLAWLGLSDEMFDHVTTYDNSHYCKPNPAYYREILETVGRQPADCLMVGNDVEEDACAAGLGMKFFLVTDSILNPDDRDISCFTHGTFADCSTHIAGLLA